MTFAYGPVTSLSSNTLAFAAITIRRGPSRSIASTIVRVESEISVVVSSATGPSAETTASAPTSTASTSRGSDGNPCRTVTASGNHCLEASRTSTTTSSPRCTAWVTTGRPVRPLAPKIAMRCMPRA